jgi:response regulator RpfG family c-di-GMP phosphodiesterase
MRAKARFSPVLYETSMSGTVILADEYPIVLDGLESLLHKSDFKILARCTTGEETLRALRRYRSDILVFDTHIPLKNGLEILREMKESKLPARSVVFTARLNDDEILARISHQELRLRLRVSKHSYESFVMVLCRSWCVSSLADGAFSVHRATI